MFGAILMVAIVHLVTMHGDPRLTGLLLEAGCDINARDSIERTALIWSASNINHICMKNFHKYGMGTNERLEVFRQILAAGPISTLKTQAATRHWTS